MTRLTQEERETLAADFTARLMAVATAIHDLVEFVREVPDDILQEYVDTVILAQVSRFKSSLDLIQFCAQASAEGEATHGRWGNAAIQAASLGLFYLTDHL